MGTPLHRKEGIVAATAANAAAASTVHLWLRASHIWSCHVCTKVRS